MERVLLLYRDKLPSEVTNVIKGVFDSYHSPTSAFITSHGWTTGDRIVMMSDDGDDSVYVINEIRGLSWTEISVDTSAYYLNTVDNLTYRFNGTSKMVETEPTPFLDGNNNQIELHEFTYSAKRMDKAPSISATFYDYECYDKIWNTDDSDQKKIRRYYNIFTFFNGERYYLKNTPTSTYENTDARYKHSLQFISERCVLEKTIMVDSVYTTYPLFNTYTDYAQDAVVQYGALYYRYLEAHSAGAWDITEVQQITGITTPVSESSKFSFYGTVIELINRINGVLVQSGISSYNQSLQTYSGYHIVFNYYKQFSTTKSYEVGDVVIYGEGDNAQYYIFNQKHNAGESWNSSEVDVYTLPGLAISFDNNTIYEALQAISSDFELMYYFDEKTIYVEEYQYDVSNQIQQGSDKALLSIEKQNKSTEIVSRMTAEGSEDNVPYYYPNPTEDGYLKPIYKRDGSTIQSVTVEKNENYENSFYKNRSKYVFKNCRLSDISAFSSSEITVTKLPDTGSGVVMKVWFQFSITSDMIDNGTTYIPIMYRNDDPMLSYIAYPVQITQQIEGTAVYSWTSGVVDKITNNEIVTFPCTTTGTYYLELQFRYRTGYPPSSIQWGGDLVTVVSGYYYPPVNLNSNDVVLDYFYSRGDLQYVNSQYAYLNEDGEWVPVSPMACLFVDPENTSRKVVYYGLNTNLYYRYDPYETISGVRPTYARFVNITVSNTELNATQYKDLYLTGKMSHRSYNKGWRLFNGGVEKDVGDTSNLNYINDYGISITGTVQFFDEIHFLVEKYLQPQPRLMPELYYKTDGGRRFYNAIQYPIRNATSSRHELDVDAGEYLDTTENVISNHYFEDAGGNYMVIQNPYEQGNKVECLVEYDDIKPTLKNAKIKVGSDGNYSPSGTEVPIDVFLEFAYDLYDSDELINTSSNESDELSYQHPYFFAKLRPLGFNLFDMAIDEGEMIVNFTTGHCGSCDFKVMVGNKFKQNTVRIWPYDSYYYNENNGNRVLEYAYHQGDLMRYDNRDLYRETSGGGFELITDLGLKDVTTSNAQTPNGVVVLPNSSAQKTFRTWGDVICTDITLSSIEESQKDTTTTPTWICLMKDLNTFGTIMPSKMRMLEPKSVTSSGSDADKFVFTHIKMPQTYIRNAEIELTKKLVKDLVLMNSEQWSFSIKFSKIYYAQNPQVVSQINENTLFSNVIYNNVAYKLHVDSFVYKVQNKDALPEITVQIEDGKNKIQYRRYSTGINILNPNWPSITPSGSNSTVSNSRKTSSRLDLISESVVSMNDSLQTLYRTKADNENVSALNYVTDQNKRQTDNVLTDLGFEKFSTTQNYSQNEIVVYDNRLYRFTTSKSSGDWDSTKAALDSVENCIFRALGIKEFDGTSHTKLNVGERFFRNGKAFTVTKAFYQDSATEETISRSSAQFSISNAMALAADTISMQQTIDSMRQSLNTINKQVLDVNSGLAVITRGVNQKLANFTNAMQEENTNTRSMLANLTRAMSESAMFDADVNVQTLAGETADYLDETSQVSSTAQAAYVELTSADRTSIYNEILAIYSKNTWGELINDVHNTYISVDNDFGYTKMIYNVSNFADDTQPAFVEFDAEQNYDIGTRLIYNKHLYELIDAYNADEQQYQWNPDLATNCDSVLTSALVYSTDSYNENSDSLFMTCGRFIESVSMDETICQIIIESGSNGILFQDLSVLVSEQCPDLIDSDGLNMITEHVISVDGYTVLQFVVIRLEMLGKIYVASTYNDDYTKDDTVHILFDLVYISNMQESVELEMREHEVISYQGNYYYCCQRADLAQSLGDNYLYCADFMVETNIMLFIESDGEVPYENCYLLLE